jgi:hypothetical protein
MAYVDPATVLSPKNAVTSIEVLYDGGQGSWSAARLGWCGKEKLGIRWNGDEGSGIGNPQSRGNPTWFVIPDELASVVLDRIEEISNQLEGSILSRYREMAQDEEHEAEAREWSEGLIGDATAQEG